MSKNLLGNTGLLVSKLCFGSLTMGPLQKNLTPEEGGRLLIHGYEGGINFVDTAELYETYPHINNALKYLRREELIIATKSYAYSKETAEKSLQKALKEMDTDTIDIFLLHEQESGLTIKGHFEALEYFIRKKEEGYIKAVGISTHRIEAVEASLKIKEIEVLHPIVNIAGLGIQDGSIEEMLAALQKAHQMGKGIYGMKPFGGGNLLRSFKECFDFVLKIPYLHSIAVGMQSIEEIEINLAIADGRLNGKELEEKIQLANKYLNIANWCELCGNCVKACSHKALTISKDKLVVDHEKCVLCGYCSRYCPQFCIKVV